MKNEKLVVSLLAGLLVAGFCVVYFLNAIFLPVFIALLLAYLLEPLVVPLERLGMKRPVAIAVVFASALLLAGVVTFFLISALRNEFSAVQVNLPAYASRLYEVIPVKAKLFFDIETPAKAYDKINEALQSLQGVSFELFRETFSLVQKAFSSTLGFVLALLGYVITPLYLYYFLKDLPQMKRVVLSLVPLRYHSPLLERLAEIDDLLAAFVRGQLSVCAILAVLYSIGLYVIGIDLAIVIGTLAGVTFIIPYFGTILGIVLAVLMAVLKFHDLLHPLLCLGWFALVQGVEGAIITPKIVGDKVGLHPVVTILALFIGGQLFGILGMLLAVPVTAVLNVMLGSLLNHYRATPYFTGE